MYELPLFPLNAVLFPHTPIYLYIFEDRYKRMIRLCLENQSPFGVVLIRQGLEALGPLAEPYSVGCTAQISQVRRLEDDRMNIVAMGKERFRIISIYKEVSPYLVGNVEPMPLINKDPGALKSSSRKLRTWVERYLKMLVESGKMKFDMRDLQTDPVELAYHSADLVQITAREKQEVLEVEKANELLDRLISIYRREIALLKAVLSNVVTVKGTFSVN